MPTPDDPNHHDPGGDASEGPEPPDEGPVPPEPPVPDPTPAEPPPGAGWVAGFPHHLLGALRAIDPAALRPRAVLYVHLHQAALTSSAPTGRGTIAKVEDAGAYLPQNLPALLGDALVKVTEVIDLNGHTPLATYVHPQWLKEQAQLISPRTCFPHSTSITRHVDYDHPEPYQHRPAPGPGSAGDSEGSAAAMAPPGQTGLHNTGPLGRYQHRVKTHAGWTVREPQPGTYVWRTPHHRYRLVDDTGTRLLDEQAGHALLNPPQPESSGSAATGGGARSRRPNPLDGIRGPDEAGHRLERALAKALHDRLHHLAEHAQTRRILHAARHTTHHHGASGLTAHLTALPDLTLAIADDYKHT